MINEDERIKELAMDIYSMLRSDHMSQAMASLLYDKGYCRQDEVIKKFAIRLQEKFNDLEYNAKTTRKTVSINELREQMDWVLHEVVPATIEECVKEVTNNKI